LAAIRTPIAGADPEIAPASLDGCFTKEELFAFQNRLNPVELTSLTEDKSVFDAYCAARAIPVPMHFATLGRVSAGSPEGHAIATREAWLRDIGPPAPGLDLHELATNRQKLRSVRRTGKSR